MILVTGGVGFIGSNIVADLCARGDDVIISDWVGSDNIKWKNIAKHPIDRIIAPETLTAFLAKQPPLTGVVHMGAISATTASDADEIVRNNFDLSRELWEFCAKREIPFVYASSAATYGDGMQGFVDENRLTEMAKLRPLNLYGWSKKWFDMWVLKQVAKNAPCPPSWAGLKFFNVYGPNELHKGDMMSVVCKSYATCATGQQVSLFQSHNPEYDHGGQLRDFVYVKDCVKVVSHILKTPNVGSIFNVGSGTARSFRDLITTAFEASGHGPNISYIEMPVTLRGRYQYFTEANLMNLRNSGYHDDMTSLEDGVLDLITNYLSNDDQHR